MSASPWPTSPRRASRIGEFYPDGDMLGAPARSIGAYTRVFNLVHLPALSVPCGFTSDGTPVGLQIGGPKLSESRLLRLALDLEGSLGLLLGNLLPLPRRPLVYRGQGVLGLLAQLDL